MLTYLACLPNEVSLVASSVEEEHLLLLRTPWRPGYPNSTKRVDEKNGKEKREGRCRWGERESSRQLF